MARSVRKTREKGQRYLVNEQGERVAVVLDLAEYRKMIEQIEELEDLRAYDAAKAANETPIPLEQAVSEMDRRRRRRNQ
jgi:prevent-host-death family protein